MARLRVQEDIDGQGKYYDHLVKYLTFAHRACFSITNNFDYNIKSSMAALGDVLSF